MVEGYTHARKRLPQSAGCEFVRAEGGDHAIWRSPITGVHFVVDGKIKSRHTADGVLRQAGLPEPF